MFCISNVNSADSIYYRNEIKQLQCIYESHSLSTYSATHKTHGLRRRRRPLPPPPPPTLSYSGVPNVFFRVKCALERESYIDLPVLL